MPIDLEKTLADIWHVLEMAREDCIPETLTGEHDAPWEDACLAMAHVREALGLPSEAEREAEAAPSWAYKFADYDGLEVAPCRDLFIDNDPTCGTCVERCSRADAEIWSVYGHCPEGGVECLEDFATEKAANTFANLALLFNATLHKHGVTFYD
jgi:hypothetical protein